MIEVLRIKEIVKLAGKQNGCRIYDIYKHWDRWQILIDKKPENRTVNLKDCENVFHSLQFLMDTELPHVLEKRRLEVSSPGIEKQLREKWHFEESIGKTMKLITISPVKAQSTKTGVSFHSQSFTASLISISRQNLHFKNDSAEYSIPFSKIKSAKLFFESSKSLKPKKSDRNKKKKHNKKRGQ